MKKEELSEFLKLNKQFQADCERVKKHMVRYDSDYLDVYSEWYINSCGECESLGDVYSRGCFMGTTFVSFDPELLAKTDEDLESYVNKLIEEKKQKKRKEAEERAKREQDTKLKMFNKLKEELGL